MTHVQRAAQVAVTSSPKPILDVRGLKTQFNTENGIVRVLNGVSFTLEPGKTLGLVGESGCGKSVTALTIMRLLQRRTANITDGEIWFRGRDLLKISDQEMAAVRGREIGLVFQDAMSSLNPVLTVGRQLTEGLIRHLGLGPAAARARAIEFMALVGIPVPQSRIDDYPHQFSGGMRQRVMIAMALACEPSLLIADEPTTALDVTIQAQILDLLKTLQKQLGMSMIIITHDMGVIANIADDVCVMYAGNVVEQATVDQLFASPSHPYTSGLLASIPSIKGDTSKPLPSIKGLPPNLANPPVGCCFSPRCPSVFAKCDERPPLFELKDAQRAACWLRQSGQQSKIISGANQ